MPSREFTDSNGVVWRVWDVTPTDLHPITRAEEFMEQYAGGWLAFESAAEKRRLPAPYPPRWLEYDLVKLEQLCRAAEPVTRKRRDTPTSVRLAGSEEKARDKSATAERTFTSPRGREWSVRLHERFREDGTSETVLRFTSGDSVMDLDDWPSDWKTLSWQEFALLILEAQPPPEPDGGEHP